MDDETNAYIKQLENQLADTNNKANQATSSLVSSSMFNSTGMDQNLIVYQLEVDNILDRLEHELRGDVIEINENGDQYYTTPKKRIIIEKQVYNKKTKQNELVKEEKMEIDEERVLLNDYGVALIMHSITPYLNRNTFISWYREERVNEILFDVANKLRVLVFCTYEKMGLDSDHKRARYASLVLSIVHTIESAYRRAINGEESKGLRTARIVTQNDPLMNHQMPSGGMRNQNKFNLLKPKTWI